MSVLNKEVTLPGSIVDIYAEYGGGYNTKEFGSTQSKIIIGTAFDGPVGVEVPIYSPEHAKYVFGPVYKDKKEATLVAEVKAAYDAGCRTIYAIRVSGKDIYKDFQMKVDTDLKLRVQGAFPSNNNKEVYMQFVNSNGQLAFKIYKPASRAVMLEKQMGLIENDEAILVNTINLDSQGFTKDSKLIDVIQVVNENQYNNVIKLTIVDANGEEVMLSSEEAKGLSAGCLFEGAYFIGRDKNVKTGETVVKYEYAPATSESSALPYTDALETVYKKLVLNTDITQEFPIFGTLQELNAKLGLMDTTLFAFLSIPESANKVFLKDTFDYDEVNISDFELYKRLGSGYAVTAMIKENGKVVETPEDNVNRVAEIKDGIYTVLENLQSDFRCLTCGTADRKISGKIPRKDDFRFAIANSTMLLKDGKEIIKATPVIKNQKDFVAKKIEIEVNSVDQIAVEFSKVYLDEIVEFFAEGMKDSLAIKGGKLSKYVSASSEYVTLEAADLTLINSKDYIVVKTFENVSVYKVDHTTFEVSPVGQVSDVIGKEDVGVTAVVNEIEGGMKITIISDSISLDTLQEFIQGLNECKILSKFLTFELPQSAIIIKDDLMEELLALGVNTKFTFEELLKDRIDKYDTNMYIPYRTTDNFARQLAQHVEYTSLKTAHTHGVIGCEKLLSVSLKSIADKVDSLLTEDYDLYIKKPNGRPLLNKDSMPYHIGHDISIVAAQKIVGTDSNYNYISNGASSYGGFICTLPLDQSSTNQLIDIDRNALMYYFTSYQLEKLTKAGYITFRLNKDRRVVVTDGITMGLPGSEFRRLSSIKANNAVSKLIRNATDPFIGKQKNITNMNAMETAIKSEVTPLIGRILKVFDFVISTDTSDNINAIDIDYIIVPSEEIVQIRNNVKVTKNR